jgi:DNA-binding NarL/FixJ family response regulator
MVPVAAPKIYSILLADSQTLIREGLAALCGSLPNYKVIDQCSDGVTALRIILANRPDIAMVDLNIPDLFTFKFFRKLRNANVPTRVVALSEHAERDTVLEVLRSGVSAFLLKSGPATQLLEAFEQILGGGIYVSSALELDYLFSSPQVSEPTRSLESLSPRESQVFSLLVEGTRAKEIGALLGISPKTVDTYRVNLMRKLDIHNVAGLVRFAMRHEHMRLGFSAQQIIIPKPTKKCE